MRVNDKRERFAWGTYGGEQTAKEAAEAFYFAAGAQLQFGASLEDAFAAAGISRSVIDRYAPQEPAFEELPPGIGYIAKGPKGAYKVYPGRKNVKDGKSFSCDTHSDLGAKTLAAQYVIWCYAKAAQSYADFAKVIRSIYRLPPAFRVEPLIALGSRLAEVPRDKANDALDSWATLAKQTVDSGPLDDFMQASNAKQPEGLSKDKQVEWQRALFAEFVNASVIQVPGKRPSDPDTCADSVKERSEALEHLVEASKANSFDPAARVDNFVALAKDYRALEVAEFHPVTPMTHAAGNPSDPMFDTKTGPLSRIKYVKNKGPHGTWKVPTHAGTRQGKGFACELHGMAAAYWLLVQHVLSKAAQSIGSGEAFTYILKRVEPLPAAFRVELLITLGGKIAKLPSSDAENALKEWVELADQTIALLATGDFAQAVGAQTPDFNDTFVAKWRSQLPVHFVNTSVLAELVAETPSDPGQCAELVQARFELLKQLVRAGKEGGAMPSDRAEKVAALLRPIPLQALPDPHREPPALPNLHSRR